MFQKRSYRDNFKGDGIIFFNVCINETDLCIGANANLYEKAFELVKLYRKQIEEYIQIDPAFLTSLSPIKPKPDSQHIIKKMCKATEKAGVGPMAAVAGAISELVGIELLKYSDEIIVENGGDIFIRTNKPRKIGIYAGNSPFSEKIAVQIEPENTPAGICTSSGTVGHSLSFGKCDATVIISKDTFLADALATATGNIVKTKDDIQKAIDFAAGYKEVDGVLIIMNDIIGIKKNINLIKI
ncbi:MAG: UPF0280 family protein [Bacteroidales bacterium]|nr:UPF0280 family protein [Bacteroidales bacterium]